MNRKGFMMAEVVVVSAIVMIVIVGLYQSYNKIYLAYTTRIKYYDATTLYRLGYYRDILITNNLLETQINKLKKKEATIIDIYSKGTNLFELPETEVSSYITDTVFLVPTKKNNNNKYIITTDVLNELNGKDIHQTFKDYLSYLSTSTSFNSNYLMLIERCNAKDKNDCYYAYLEIYDGEE